MGYRQWDARAVKSPRGKAPSRSPGSSPGSAKEAGLTQAEVAARLGTLQAVVSDYEKGNLRLHAELVLKLADILGVSTEELLGRTKPRREDVKFPSPRLLRRARQFEKLPRRDQDVVIRMIDSLIEAAQAKKAG